MDKNSPHQFSRAFYGPRYWPTWASLACFFLMARLPLKLNAILGRFFGWLLYHLAIPRRRIAETNIRLCFPELSAAEQRKMVRDIFHSCGMIIPETAMGLWGHPNKLRKHYRVTGLEHVQAAMASGRGVLLVGGHFTTLDLAGRIMSMLFQFDVVYRKDKNPLLGYYIAKGRESFASNAIVRSDTRQLIKNLRQGHVVWYAPDQDYGSGRSLFAPFFGLQAASVTGTPRIVEMSNAIVIPFAHFRDNDGHYRLVFEPCLENFPTDNLQADVTRINQIIEALIRLKPEQYLWVHRRFKTRPQGESDLYTL